MRKPTVVRAISVLVVAGTICAIFRHYELDSATTENWMDTHVRGQGLHGILVYIALVALLTGVGIPRQICAFLGGYVFGMVQGTLFATIGTTIACCTCFSYARFLGQDWIQARFGHKITPLQNFLCRSPFVLTLLVRIIPLGSNFLTNFLAGVSKMPALPFLSGSCCGFIIQNLIFAMLGSGLQMSDGRQAVISAVLYALSLSVGYRIYRQYKSEKEKKTLI